jgi:hypothetical protein
MSLDYLSDLSLEEKAALLSGDGRWRTKGIPRLGIKAVKVNNLSTKCQSKLIYLAE